MHSQTTNSKKILVTGVKSGLGKYLFENLKNTYGLDRHNFNKISNHSFDIIVHCAFNKQTKNLNHKEYLNDNLFLIKKLKKINHKKFVYISSIDVYSKELNLYSIFKQFAESLLDDNDYILRCSMILGPESKENHLMRLSKNQKITLSRDSNFNYILMEDIKSVLESEFFYTINTKIPFDFVANDSIEIKNVMKFLNSKSKIGNYYYNSRYKFTNPIYNYFPNLNKSSLENLKIFLK